MTQPTARGTAPVPPGPPRAQATAAVPTPPVMQARPLIALAGNTALAAGETVAAVGGAPALVALAAVGAVAAVGTVASRTRAHRARRAAAGRRLVGASGGGRGGGPLFGGRSAGGRGTPAGAGRSGSTGGPTGRTRAGGPGAPAGVGDRPSTGRKPLWRRRPGRAAGTSGGAYDPGVPDTKRRRRRKRGDDPATGHGRDGKKKDKRGTCGRKPAAGTPPTPERRAAALPNRAAQRRPTIAPTVTPIDTPKPETPAPPAKPAGAGRHRTPAVTSSTAAATGGTPVTSPHRSPSPMLAMKAIIEDDFPKIIARFDPQGIEEVIAEYALWPGVLEALADRWRQMRTIAEADYPLHPVIAGLLEAVDKHQRAVGTTAAEVPPLIGKVHADRLADMADRRNAMWDHRANPDTAAQPKPTGS